MKRKVNIKILFAFLGILLSKKMPKSTTSNGEVLERALYQENEDFKHQYISWEYPDPETLESSYDPQRDGN